MRKLISLITFCLLIFTFAFSFESHAQSLEDIKIQMVKDWERARAYTLDYLSVMPADKYSAKATDSTRSFAQQMLHLAQGNCGLMSTATGIKPPSFAQAKLEQSATAQTKDSVTYYVTSSYDFCINAVKNTDTKNWNEKKKIFSFEETTLAMMNKTFEHQTHHRGQATIYIRLQGIKPPQERLF